MDERNMVPEAELTDKEPIDDLEDDFPPEASAEEQPEAANAEKTGKKRKKWQERSLSERKWLTLLIELAIMAAVLLILNVVLPAGVFMKFEETDGGYSVSDYTEIPIWVYRSRVAVPSKHRGQPVVSIGKRAFSSGDMKEVVIPDSVTSIGFYAFADCDHMEKITLPDSVSSIGTNAFYGCDALTEVELSDGLTTIDYGAFWGCSSLKEITIPDSVTSIGFNAFADCTALRDITIPDSITYIGIFAFDGCDITVHAPHKAEYYGEKKYDGVAMWIVE